VNECRKKEQAMNKKKFLVLFFPLAISLLSGCSVMPGPSSLIEPPKTISSERKNPSAAEIAKGFLPQGYKLTQPMMATQELYGDKLTPNMPLEYKTSVIEKDLNNDGKKEIIFFIKSAANFYDGGFIILQNKNGVWRKVLENKGEGESVARIDFADVDGDGKKDILISQFVGASAGEALSIYTFKDKPKNIINTAYNRMEVADMPDKNGKKDGKAELALWLHDTGNLYMIDVYRYNGKNLSLAQDVYQGYFKTVVKYYENIMSELRKQDPKYDNAYVEYYLADSYIKAGLYNQGLAVLSKIDFLIKQKNCNENNVDFIFRLNILKGKAYMGLKKFNDAENIFKLSINIANKTKAYDSNNKEIINYRNVIEGYRNLYLLYKQNGEKSKANQVKSEIEKLIKKDLVLQPYNKEIFDEYDIE
jgi:hypothetical protein